MPWHGQDRGCSASSPPPSCRHTLFHKSVRRWRWKAESTYIVCARSPRHCRPPASALLLREAYTAASVWKTVVMRSVTHFSASKTGSIRPVSRTSSTCFWNMSLYTEHLFASCWHAFCPAQVNMRRNELKYATRLAIFGVLRHLLNLLNELWYDGNARDRREVG